MRICELAGLSARDLETSEWQFNWAVTHWHESNMSRGLLVKKMWLLWGKHDRI